MSGVFLIRLWLPGKTPGRGVCHPTAAPGAANPLATLSPSYPRTTTPRCLARKSLWQLPSSKDPLTWNAIDLLPRCDYKEFFEPAKLFLGADLRRQL